MEKESGKKSFEELSSAEKSVYYKQAEYLISKNYTEEDQEKLAQKIYESRWGNQRS